MSFDHFSFDMVFILIHLCTLFVYVDFTLNMVMLGFWSYNAIYMQNLSINIIIFPKTKGRGNPSFLKYTLKGLDGWFVLTQSDQSTYFTCQKKWIKPNCPDVSPFILMIFRIDLVINQNSVTVFLSFKVYWMVCDLLYIIFPFC